MSDKVMELQIKSELCEHSSCDMCQKKYNDTEELSFHRVIYHECYNCSMCELSFAYEHEKAEHEIYKHFPLKCYHCNESFMCNQLLNKHILILHNCKVCDFCLEKIHPKEKYLEHLLHYHRIKSTLHYSEVNGSYLILDVQDEINFQCKLCNEGYPIELFYMHFTNTHHIKVRILLNIIQKMNVKDYIKSELNFYSRANKVLHSNSINENKNSILKSNVCVICQHIYNANVPKEFHDIYCNGLYQCHECDLIFDSKSEEKCHVRNCHFVYCPLGCQNVELATKELLEHCTKVHCIVTCMYCGIFVSVMSKYLNGHLEIEHKYKSDISNYMDENLFILINSVVRCALCSIDLTSFMHSLEKIVFHFSNYHNLSIKSIENLLVQNPLISKDINISNHMQLANKPAEDISENNKVKKITNDYVFREKGGTSDIESAGMKANEELPIESLARQTHLDYICNNNKDEDKIQSKFHTCKNDDNLNNERKLCQSNEIEDFDMNGYNDINFSEVQCIFSDTSDDAMSDIEVKSKTENTNLLKDKNNIRVFRKNSKSIRKENMILFNANFIMTCEVCLNGFDKRDMYMKHLEKLHGFKTKMETEFTNEMNKDNKTVIAKNVHKPSKYIAVIKKVKNPLYLCLVCKMETTSKMSARKHFRTHDLWTKVKCDSLEIGYKCRFCSNLFWTIEKRNRHQVNRHLTESDKEKFMKCYMCTTLFSSKTCLKRHLRVEHSKAQMYATIAYKCLHCCKLYPDLSTVRAHFENDHPNSKSLYCSLAKCRTKCSNKKVLQRHYKRLHTRSRPGPQNCNLCGKLMKSLHSMQLHMHMKHGENRPGYKCRVCEDRFDSDTERKAHMQTEHPGVSTFFCKFCDKAFRSKSGLNGHAQIHREINLSCPHCQKDFTRRDSYLEHLLIHNGPRHKCNICEKEFVQRSNLIRHTRTHTGDKPYFCRYCFKRFADKGACNSHERVHTREEVSACPYCNQTFSKKQKLKYHIRKHTGEGLEKCSICEKKFTSGYSLRKHMEIHERRSLKCTYECGKTFVCEEYLQRHVSITHRKPVKQIDETSVFAFYCQICPKGYNTKAKLKDHIITHPTLKNINLYDQNCDAVVTQTDGDMDDKDALHAKLFLQPEVLETALESNHTISQKLSNSSTKD